MQAAKPLVCSIDLAVADCRVPGPGSCSHGCVNDEAITALGRNPDQVKKLIGRTGLCCFGASGNCWWTIGRKECQ